MIHIPTSQDNLISSLSVDFIADKQPLRDYAGFETGSKYEGQARQTFSLLLSSASLANIRQSVAELYTQLIDACWPVGQPLPFDMVRFDAFLDPKDDSLKIIELNTRNVGLHEASEWLDGVVAKQLNTKPEWSLNQHFVANQKHIHDNHFGADAPLLFMSKLEIPRWTYFDALVDAYPRVHDVSDPAECELTEAGIIAGGATYQAVARKFSWDADEALTGLDASGAISVLQPLWMRPFGHKDYLPQFDSPAILKSEIFNPDSIDDYIQRKDQLVLKVIDSGGSKSVYLGPLSALRDWRSHLAIAAKEPKQWVLQDYIAPPVHMVIAHAQGARQIPIQLGIFVLPNPASPHDFSIDLVVKGYAGQDAHFTFDPSGLNPDIWFGQVLVSTT